MVLSKEPQCFHQMFQVETSIDNRMAQMRCLMFGICFCFFPYLSLLGMSPEVITEHCVFLMVLAELHADI